MKKVFYNKLIRDKVPDYLSESGKGFEHYQMNEGQFRKELLKKVGEEASGLENAETRDEIIAELADVMDVLSEVCATFGVSTEDVEAERAEKMRKKGGFLKRYFLIWSEDDGYKTNERRNV